MTAMLQPTLFDLDISTLVAAPATSFAQMLGSLGVEPGTGWPDRFGAALRRWVETQPLPPLRTLSLFSGGGGLDIAFHDVGFSVGEMIELDQRFAQTLAANAGPDGSLHGSTAHCLDIRDYVPPADLVVDFIIGGPPCQTFSAAGRRAAGVAGTDDPRGTLFQEYVRLLTLLKPRGFLFENVGGITGAGGGEDWRLIQTAFREAGYRIHTRLLDSADYGVPQHRERMFIVGLREEEATYCFPAPTHGPDAPTPSPFYTAGEAVAGADSSGVAASIAGRYGPLIADIPPGLNYSFYTKEMGHPSPVFSWRSKFSDFMYKADPAAPVRTIKAQGGQYTGPFSWHNRHFSVGELKRLQTIPDDYLLVGSRAVCIQQIGNSVPPQLGRMLALSILHQLFGVELPFALPYLRAEQPLGFRQRKRDLTAQYAAKAKAALPSSVGPTSNSAALPNPALHYLTPSFELRRDYVATASPVMLRYEEAEGVLTITANPPEQMNTEAAYRIHVAPTTSWGLPWREVVLAVGSYEPALYPAVWKGWEELVADRHNAADLVQLCGYYQYRPKFRARLHTKQLAPPLWSGLGQVVAGVGLGRQLPVAQLAACWEVDEAEVLPVLHLLKSMGYEVRSHNTNRQIAEGEYLIPYAFPTLNPRSLQLRKQL